MCTSSSLGAPASLGGYPHSWQGVEHRYAHSKVSSLFRAGRKRTRTTLRTLGIAPTVTRRAALRQLPDAPRSQVLSLLPSASLARS